MNTKLWSICSVILILALLLGAAGLTGAVDPFFHYHEPLEQLAYPLTSQRYQNDGIVRNFSYDGLITGTSMTENFKTSEMDALFSTNSVKVSFSGGTYEEITSIVQQALRHNSGIRCIIYGLDEWNLYGGKDLILADGEYPTYLYDDDIFNDVQYLLNKEIFCANTLEVLDYTAKGNQTTTFDDYSSWSLPSGREVVLSKYVRPDPLETPLTFSEHLENNLRENLQINLVDLAQAHPDTQFLIFFPPYSILNWDAHQCQGITDLHVDAMTVATEVLLQADNIQVYSFYNDYDLCTNLDNYHDTVHHRSEINSLLLERMYNGEYRLTKDNYKQHWEEVREFYSTYDYDALFREQ